MTVALVLAASLAVGTLAREALALRREALAGERDLRNARAVLDSGTAGGAEFRLTGAQLAQARAELARARTRFESAQRRTRLLRPVLWLAGRVPGWPDGAPEIGPLLETSRLLALSGENLADGLAPLARQVDGAGDSSMPAGTRLAGALAEGEPSLRMALLHLDQARVERARVDAVRLRGPLARARAGLEEFDRAWSDLREDLVDLIELAPAARAVLGMDGPRTYAVLGQNSTEIRPTGGFIGSLGLVTLDGGRVTHQDYRSSYAFDNPRVPAPPAPAPIARHLGGGGWTLRDANWSPDFPTTAKTVEGFLSVNQGITVDGVIAFDTYAVGEILRVLGAVPVPGFPEPVTAGQWYGLATDLIYGDPNDSGSEIEVNKGQVLGPMLRAVSERLQDAHAEELPALLRALRSAVAERHILLSFHDPAPAALARRHGADGRLAPPADADVLYVVDANLSYSKTGPYVRERITYEATLSPRGIATESRVVVSYDNMVTPEILRQERIKRIGGAEWDPQRRNLRESPGLLGTYVRVYLPRGSRLFGFGDRPPPALETEAGLTSLGQYVRVAPGAAARLEYHYQTPTDLTPPGTYRLRILKQAGTAGHDLEIRLNLSPGARVRATSPELTREGDTLVYRAPLTRDLDLLVAFDPAGE